MPQKKETTTPSLSAEEQDQVQALLTGYHQIADRLHQSGDQAQLENVLAEITALSEAAQLTLVKALGRQHDRAAADILVVVNELGSSKELRKEARRALLRLEAAKVVTQWQPPIVRTPAVQVNVANAPRFWKGLVTQSREEGEVQLILCWEQGYDYAEARLLTFQLDFWNDGVKGVMIESGTRRNINDYLQSIRAELAGITFVDCSLAAGRRLLEEALSVNAWRGTKPDTSYTNQLPTINKLVLQVEESDLGKESGDNFITPGMEEQEVVVNFLGAWSFGDFGLAYDLLSTGSSIREGLARDEWVERHRAWYQEAHPTRMELGFVHPRDAQQSSALWLPSSANRLPARKELEVGWSLELLDTPLSGTLLEMPMGTATNKETGRRWFWTDYTLTREQGAWRIQQWSDAGLALQGVAPVELQSRIKTYEAAIDQAAQRVREDPQRDVQRYIEELSWRLTQMLHFYDALLKQLSLDYTLYEDAYNHAVLIGNPERITVYLEQMLQRFQERRGENLRRLGSTLVGLAYKYEDPALLQRRQHLLMRAEEVLRESISVENSAGGHLLLAELLLSQERNDEAETELLTARTLHPTLDEEAAIEAGLGNSAMRHERVADALTYYQRVAALNPRYTGIWFNVGFAHRLLGQLDDAESSYQRAIEADPEDVRPYSELCALYIMRGEHARARELLERGMRLNPQSAYLHALLASVHAEMGNQRAAEQQLAEAERLEPDLEIVQQVRQHIQNVKKKS